MRELLCPAIYHHFKNKDYATMGVSKPATDDTLTSLESTTFKAKHTETQRIINILRDKNGELYHDSDEDEGELVVYVSLYDDHIPYARPKEMFLDFVDKEKYPDIKQEYRFELVKYRSEGDKSWEISFGTP